MDMSNLNSNKLDLSIDLYELELAIIAQEAGIISDQQLDTLIDAYGTLAIIGQRIPGYGIVERAALHEFMQLDKMRTIRKQR